MHISVRSKYSIQEYREKTPPITRRERQAAGIAVAKAAGVYLGRKAGTTKAKPRRAKELRGKGLTVPEIAVAMSVPERTVFNYLGK